MVSTPPGNADDKDEERVLGPSALAQVIYQVRTPAAIISSESLLTVF
jgi:hypothetical protein